MALRELSAAEFSQLGHCRRWIRGNWQMSQTATLVKPWIHCTLVELLKNSMAVAVEQAEVSVNNHWNPATRPLCIALEQTETFLLLIHVHDQGGVVCQQRRKQGKSVDVDLLFAFALSRRKWDPLQDQQTHAMTRSPLQGLEAGLSLSRIMMRHLGGDLQLMDRLDPFSLSLHETVELEKGDYDHCMESKFGFRRGRIVERRVETFGTR
jgi:hypothetical protein